MIIKTLRSGNGRKTLGYVARTNQATQATVIDGSLMPLGNLSNTPEQQHTNLLNQAKSMLRVQDSLSTKDDKEPIVHWVMSLPESENLTDQQFKTLSQHFIASMVVTGREPELLHNPAALKKTRKKFIEEELPYFQYSTVRHHDRDHPHIHIVIGRRDTRTGKSISKAFESYRSVEISTQLEREYRLTPATNRNLDSSNKTDKLLSGYFAYNVAKGESEITLRNHKIRILEADDKGNKKRLNIYRKIRSDNTTERYSTRSIYTLNAFANYNEGKGSKNYSMSDTEAQEIREQVYQELIQLPEATQKEITKRIQQRQRTIAQQTKPKSRDIER